MHARVVVLILLLLAATSVSSLDLSQSPFYFDEHDDSGLNPEATNNENSQSEKNQAENSQGNSWAATGNGGAVSGRSNHASNLSWGPNSGLNVFVEPGGFIVLSINITNGANVSDAVDFTILGQSGWNCFWNGTSTPCDQPNSIQMTPGFLAWPKFDIYIPEVTNGTPSAFVKHPFTMTATSGLDGAEVNYSFTLEVDEWHAAAIDSGAANLTLDPGLKQRTPITVRNLGNAPASIVVRVVPLDSDGEPIEGYTPAISFQTSGWLVGIFNIHLLNGPGAQGMLPNTAITVDVEVQPPSQTTGNMRIGILVWSAMNPYEPVMVEVNSSIVWQRAGGLEIDDDCGDDILPNGFCNSQISVTNNGNFDDTFEILVVTSEEWLRADLSRSQISVPMGETVEAATLMLRVEGMAAAFSHGEAIISLHLSDGQELGTSSVELRVGPLVQWDLSAVENSTDSRDNVSVAFTLRNLGNGDDGLQIGLHVDMNVEHGLVPPEGATHGATDGIPRFFEIDQVPPGVNFTFRAWMHIPRGMEANGTVTMTVEMQSTLQPNIIFINETGAEFLAESYRPENIHEATTWEIFELQVANFWNQFNGLCFTIIVAVVGGLALYRATAYRMRRDQEWEAKLKAQEPPVKEESEEWLAKFRQGAGAVPAAVAGAVIEAPKVAAKVFTDLFSSKAKKRKAERPPPNPALLDAANTVLTHHESDKELERLDDLATGIGDLSEKHPANVLLPDPEPDIGRTVRKPKRKSPKTSTKSASKTTSPKSASKPTSSQTGGSNDGGLDSESETDEDGLPDFTSPNSKGAGSKDSQAATSAALDEDGEFDLDL
jgi:hypothetical protein